MIREYNFVFRSSLRTAILTDSFKINAIAFASSKGAQRRYLVMFAGLYSYTEAY
jgi:hypothetical protein